jgi:preprotein translocase subunit SecD
MKINNLFTAILLFVTVISASAFQSGGKKIVLHPSVSTASVEMLRSSATIISSRLEKFGMKDYSVVVGADGKSLNVSLATDKLSPELSYLLTASGEVSFYETYNRSEALKLLNDKGRLQAALSVPEKGPDNDPRIGCAERSVFSTADNAVKSASTGKRLRLMWSAGGENGMICLFAVATSDNGGPLVSEKMIESVGLSEGKADASLRITLKPDAKNVFAEATKRNIGRSIVIVIDGKVYSWPVVRSVIDQGQIEVTGKFTQQEILVLPLIFNTGVLPSPMTISE